MNRRSFVSGALASAVTVPAIADVLPRTVVVSDQIFIGMRDIATTLRKMHAMRDCDRLIVQYCYFCDEPPSEADVCDWRKFVARMKRGEEAIDSFLWPPSEDKT